MLSTTEIAEELERVSYKPGWSFEAYEDRWEGPHILIVVKAVSAYRPVETLDLGIRSALPPFAHPSDLHDWLMWRIGRIEMHELREFYRVDGRLVDDPHASEEDDRGH
jgi:hypothetical protein